MKNDLFDQKLAQIEFYKKFPAMIPFVGENYVSKEHKKLLLIGESYYLPNDVTLHHNPEKWYNDSQDSLYNLDPNFVAWINCKELLNSEWDCDGHYTYKELNRSINDLPFTKSKRGIDEIAFTNYFQRPSQKEGDSMSHFCTKLDVEKSKEILKDVIKTLSPDIIIFVSKYSWDCDNEYIKKEFPNIIVDFTCHPATNSKYWLNSSYPHNKNKFMNLLKENFLVKSN